MGDNLPTAEMTSVSEKEGRKRLQRNGGGGSENGEEERRRTEEGDVAVRETLCKEGGKKGGGAVERERERRPYLGILRRRPPPPRSSGPCGTASPRDGPPAPLPTHRYRDVTADKITDSLLHRHRHRVVG